MKKHRNNASRVASSTASPAPSASHSSEKCAAQDARDAKTPDSGSSRGAWDKPDRDRRARGSAPRSQGRVPSPRAKGPNGPGSPFDSAQGKPAQAGKAAQAGRAASGDARENSDRETAPSAAVLAARDGPMHRDEAYAEVAASRTNGELPRVPGDSEQSLNDLPDLSLIADGAAFAHAVSAHENLPGVFVKLLRSEDEKIKQRAAERLVEMKFGKGSAPPDEPPQIILDAPRPERD